MSGGCDQLVWVGEKPMQHMLEVVSDSCKKCDHKGKWSLWVSVMFNNDKLLRQC